MIVEMEPSATAGNLAAVIDRMERGGSSVTVVRWPKRSFVIGGWLAAEDDDIAGLAGVLRAVGTRGPWHLVGREFRADQLIVPVGSAAIGDGRFTVIAGPCAVESREQLAAIAAVVSSAGASLMRGGAFKPRTSPYSFQGLGAEGLRLIAEQRRVTGLPVVTEVMAPGQVEAVAAHADMLQIGTRNMQNYPLLREVGRCGRPVLLKRAMAATIEEWLLAAEYVLAEGNPHVVLCERGIRTFESAYRFTLDLSAVALVKRLSHLPVIVDPSHASGDSALVPRLALAAAAVGADGVLLDVHPDRRSARCDGGQALTPAEFRQLVTDIGRIMKAVSEIARDA